MQSRQNLPVPVPLPEGKLKEKPDWFTTDPSSLSGVEGRGSLGVVWHCCASVPTMELFGTSAIHIGNCFVRFIFQEN